MPCTPSHNPLHSCITKCTHDESTPLLHGEAKLRREAKFPRCSTHAQRQRFYGSMQCACSHIPLDLQVTRTRARNSKNEGPMLRMPLHCPPHSYITSLSAPMMILFRRFTAKQSFAVKLSFQGACAMGSSLICTRLNAHMIDPMSKASFPNACLWWHVHRPTTENVPAAMQHDCWSFCSFGRKLNCTCTHTHTQTHTLKTQFA